MKICKYINNINTRTGKKTKKPQQKYIKQKEINDLLTVCSSMGLLMSDGEA